MSRYNSLVQERADLVAEQGRLFAGSEGRGLTDDEKRRDDEIAASLERVNDDIRREERRREGERTVAAQPVRLADPTRGRQADDPMWGWANAAEFARAVQRASAGGGQLDERLLIGAAPTNYHQETGGTSGEGYMVPPQMRDGIWDLINNGGGDDGPNLLQLVNPERTASNAVQYVKDETTIWAATGVRAAWRSEAVQMSATKLITSQGFLALHELYAFVTATDELLQDAPRLNDRVTVRAAAAIRYQVNKAIIEGTGAGQPLGWTASGAPFVSVAKESGQAADTVVTNNVLKMYARVINPAAAIWLVNQDVLPQLFGMTLANNGLWFPPQAGIAGAPGGTLLGRPVFVSEHCETLGDQGDIQFVNPAGYYAVTRTGAPDFASSIHLFFDYNVTAFRWTFRLGGTPILSAPISPAKGSATRSHFVQLDARA